MGVFKNAWATFKLATSRQRELTDGFADIGVNFMHLDAKFTKHLLQEAIDTDAATVVAKYASLVQSIMITEGRIVTPEFNRRLQSRFTQFLHQASKPTRPTFPIDPYKLDLPFGGLDGLFEFTAKEYDAVGGRAFEGERNYNAPNIEFRGQRWGVKLQTVYGHVSKIVLHTVFSNKHEANPVAMDMLNYCVEMLGKTAEQQTGLFIWDTADGNVNMVTGETVGGFEICLSLNAFDRSTGALLLSGPKVANTLAARDNAFADDTTK